MGAGPRKLKDFQQDSKVLKYLGIQLAYKKHELLDIRTKTTRGTVTQRKDRAQRAPSTLTDPTTPKKIDSTKTPSSAPPPPPGPDPPPRVVFTASKPAIESPSHYLDSLASTPEDYLTRPLTEPYQEPTYEPTFYFFYGTLTQPEILRHVLDIPKDQDTKLRPAKLVGYSLTNWGQYKALIDGEPGEEVRGQAYFVTSIEDEYKLARYETTAYQAKKCKIFFEDGTEPGEEAVLGMTFKYAGDDQALKDGRFDRVLWELQMGTRLPGSWRTRRRCRGRCVGHDGE